ncbi:hypothetical protein J6590_031430 [Homalodisca vitripennis]|nr:hypothetical protein J6590_031430 [Homalodisca vitripennis]
MTSLLFKLQDGEVEEGESYKYGGGRPIINRRTRRLVSLLLLKGDKGPLRTPEVYRQTRQIHNLSSSTNCRKQPVTSSRGKHATLVRTTKDGVALPCPCRTVKEQMFSSLPLLVTHSTERILPDNANFVKLFP